MHRDATATDAETWDVPSLSLSRESSAAIESSLREMLPRPAEANTDAERLARGAAARQAIDACAPQVGAFLARLKLLDGRPAALVSGLPTFAHDSQLIFAEAISLGLGLHLGEPFQYEQQNEGRIAARLAPKPGAAANSNATRDEFKHHTDDACVPPEYRTRWISLYGVRNDNAASTGFAPAERIAAALSAEAVRTLESPRYQFKAPSSFQLGEAWSRPRPIFWRDERGRRCISCPTYNTRPAAAEDAEAAAALEALKAALSSCTTFVCVAPGTFFVFDNDRGTHCRMPIVGERLVLRSYWRADLRALRSATGQPGNVFDLRRIWTQL